MQLARDHEIVVVEDNAHGLLGRTNDVYLGTFGELSTLSFHETKNFSCGEGGALLINDTRLIERAKIVWEKGTNRSAFFRGEVDKYSWVDIGSSYLPSDILAGYLWGQFENHETIQLQRRQIWERYASELKDWAQENGIQLPTIPSNRESAYHLFHIILPTIGMRQGLIDHLSQHGIKAVFHYTPLHISNMGQQYGGRVGDCPISENRQ